MKELPTVAVVPVRAGSERVVKKNFRPFVDGASLLDWKLRQLTESEVFDEIVVSSDAEAARSAAKEWGVRFDERSRHYASHDASWSDVICKVVAMLPVRDALVVWTHVTNPLFGRYQEIVDAFMKAGKDVDSAVAVRRAQEFRLNAEGRPTNYLWGPWHPYSQDLKAEYIVTGAAFVATKVNMLKWQYVAGLHPLLFELSLRESLDINTEEEFELCRELLWRTKGHDDAG